MLMRAATLYLGAGRVMNGTNMIPRFTLRGQIQNAKRKIRTFCCDYDPNAYAMNLRFSQNVGDARLASCPPLMKRFCTRPINQ